MIWSYCLRVIRIYNFVIYYVKQISCNNISLIYRNIEFSTIIFAVKNRIPPLAKDAENLRDSASLILHFTRPDLPFFF